MVFFSFDSLANPSLALNCQLLSYNLTPIPRTVDKWVIVSNTMPFSFASQNDFLMSWIKPQINLSIYSLLWFRVKMPSHALQTLAFSAAPPSVFLPHGHKDFQKLLNKKVISVTLQHLPSCPNCPPS